MIKRKESILEKIEKIKIMVHGGFHPDDFETDVTGRIYHQELLDQVNDLQNHLIILNNDNDDTKLI